MRRLFAIAVALVLSMLAGAATPYATRAVNPLICSESVSSSFVGLVKVASPNTSDGPFIAAVADIDWNTLRGSDVSAWAMLANIGGSISVAQVGIMICNAEPVYFAAWGSGAPFEPGSFYEERTFGPADISIKHNFRVARGNTSDSLRFSIDGVEVLRLAPDPLPWRTTTARVMAESHDGGCWPSVKVTNAHTRGGRIMDWGTQATNVWCSWKLAESNWYPTSGPPFTGFRIFA